MSLDVPGLLILFLRVYEMLLVMRILLSWVSVDSSSVWIERLITVTDPVLLPFREIYFRIIDKLNVQIPIDLSPILVFILIELLQGFLMAL
jgi:uncharacterized protein YggT (Ycf19 family)